MRRSRVQSILDQLLDDRSGALDDLPCCDLVDQRVGERTNPALAAASLRVDCSTRSYLRIR